MISNVVVVTFYIVVNITRIIFGYRDNTHKDIMATAQTILFTIILCDPGILYYICQYKIRVKENVSLRRRIVINIVTKALIFTLALIIVVLLCIFIYPQILSIVGIHFVLVSVMALFLLGRTGLIFFIRKLEIIRNNSFRF